MRPERGRRMHESIGFASIEPGGSKSFAEDIIVTVVRNEQTKGYIIFSGLAYSHFHLIMYLVFT